MAVREKPIIFKSDMVRAILEGRKTQTRRPIKVKAYADSWECDGCKPNWPMAQDKYGEYHKVPCPYGKVGDRLWVRETWADVNTSEGPAIMYRADNQIITWHDFCKEKGEDFGAGPSMNYDKYPGNYSMWWEDLLNKEPYHNWRPSIHMPRWASRITLEIPDVRVERVQDISEKDAIAEGSLFLNDPCGKVSWSLGFARACFITLWNSIYGPDAWERNDWVWVITFKRIDK